MIVDIAVTTGEDHEGQELLAQLARVEEQTGFKPQVMTADAAYASSANYAELEKAGVLAVIPPQREGKPRTGMPVQRFAYDARHDCVRCPAGKRLRRGSRSANGWWYRARGRDCWACPRRQQCLPGKARSRSVSITEGYPALLRARRRRLQGWPESMKHAYARHRWLVEGVHGEGKTQHGLRRAVRRGLANVRIQSYLTGAVINLKRLARAVARGLVGPGRGPRHRRLHFAGPPSLHQRRPFWYRRTRNARWRDGARG